MFDPNYITSIFCNETSFFNIEEKLCSFRYFRFFVKMILFARFFFSKNGLSELLIGSSRLVHVLDLSF
jgi:hypothetical protein